MSLGVPVVGSRSESPRRQLHPPRPSTCTHLTPKRASPQLASTPSAEAACMYVYWGSRLGLGPTLDAAQTPSPLAGVFFCTHTLQKRITLRLIPP